MKTGFIGAGKVGCSLGRYFTEKGRGLGLSVEGYFSRSVESAKEAARFTDSKPYESIEGLIKQCDVIFLTVPDGSIGSVWQQVRRCDINGKTICHCSGAMSAQDAFEGIEETGAFGYSVHPLFAVSDKYNAYRELTGVFFTLEGDGASEKAPGQGRHGTFHELQKILEIMGNPTYVIDSRDKTMYHCAAAVASNLVCGLIDQSVAMMRRCGFSEKDAVKALSPILTGNMAHVAADGPAASLTGPIERNDVTTVKKHLGCLRDDELEVYRLLSRRLVGMAQSRHPERDYGEMSLLLDAGKEEER